MSAYQSVGKGEDKYDVSSGYSSSQSFLPGGAPQKLLWTKLVVAGLVLASILGIAAIPVAWVTQTETASSGGASSVIWVSVSPAIGVTLCVYYGTPSESCQSGSISDNLTNKFVGANRFALGAAIALVVLVLIITALSMRAFLTKSTSVPLFSRVLRVCTSAGILAFVNAIQYIAVGESEGTDTSGIPPGIDISTKTVYAPGPALTFVIAILLAGVGYASWKARALEV